MLIDEESRSLNLAQALRKQLGTGRIKDADHQMGAESARITLLHEIETFLGAKVPPGDAGTTAATN